MSFVRIVLFFLPGFHTVKVFFSQNFFFYLPGRRHTLDLAASALAGLASTEDFTKVRLRKTAGPEGKDEYRGTKPIMLIHIKGDEKNAISIYIQRERAEDKFNYRSYSHNLSSCHIRA